MTPPPGYEVRCPLHGSIAFNERERRLIDHRWYQRLRSISQLGFAEAVFPGATHTRFSHGLGVMHLAGRIFDQVMDAAGSPVRARFAPAERAYFRQLVRLAGLFHDLGHAPFSHSFEALMPPRGSLPLPWPWYGEDGHEGRASHEDYSVAIISAIAREPAAPLGAEEAQELCALIDHRIRPTARLTGSGDPARNLHPLLRQIISGEIDADRMDYLRRDAVYTGVAYGHFDQDRLIQSLACVETPQGLALALDRGAIYTYENFLMARFHMAMQVYFHKTLLPFDHFLAMAVREHEIPFALDGSLENFLSAREDLIRAQLLAARHRRWASRIVDRHPLTRLLPLHEGIPAEQREALFAALAAAGIETLHLREERRLSTLGGEHPASAPPPLLVQEQVLGRARLRALPEVSVLLERYNQTFVVENLYCDRAVAPAATAVLRRVLGA
ncbi:MAG: HD domain-containing protein [Candidatus Lambdaproteobacteria bacterium]|nr:HD domain-containing protein [Candidatus Lambdaproteobacteria bacterium]